MIADKQVKTTPHQTSIDQNFDRSSIAIDLNITNTFPCVNNLLSDLISNKKGFFQDPGLGAFFSSGALRLVLSEKELTPDIGGRSVHAGINGDGLFRDTLFLNSYYFSKASREYVVAVVVHESIHAFLTWCYLSYSEGLNGVDTLFLQKHFPKHWEWLTDTSLSEQRQHILMSENFLDIIAQNVYLYTSPKSTASLRDSVARSLAWGGLNSTPAWRALQVDTCYLHEVDIWARRVDLGGKAYVDYPHCYRTDSTFFDHLNLTPICQ